MDHAGHGYSDPVKPPAQYSLPLLLDDVASFLTLPTVAGPKIAVAMSMGGMLTCRVLEEVAAAGKESPVAGLVLVDVAPDLAPSGVGELLAIAAHPGFSTMDEAFDVVRAMNPTRPSHLLRARLQQALRWDEAAGRFVWRLDPAFAENVGDLLDSLFERRPVRTLGIPVLLLRGGVSKVLSAEAAAAFAASFAAPGCRVLEVPGAGHSLPGDAPDLFAEAVLDFAETLQGGAGSSRM
jgi:pimeloyl-ACP methyl ester carboxylesterase